MSSPAPNLLGNDESGHREHSSGQLPWTLAGLALLGVAAYGATVFVGHFAFPARGLDAALADLTRERHGLARLAHALPVALAWVAAAAAAVWARARRLPTDTSALWRTAAALWPVGLLLPVLWYDDVKGRALLGGLVVGVAAYRAWPLLAHAPFPVATAALRQAEGRLAALIAAGSGAVLFAVALRRHEAHWSSHIDLGLFYEQYDNAQGVLLYAPTLGQSFLGEHFSPILAVLYPLLKLAPSPVTLLAVQAASIALGGWLLFLWARDRLGHGVLALVLMLAYVWNPYVQQAAYYDFHMDMLEPPLLFGLLLALERRKSALVWLCAIGLWCTKEDTFLYTSVIGAWAFLFEGRRRLGAALVLVGLVQGLVVLAFVLPALRAPHDPAFFSTTGATEGYHFLGRYNHLGSSLGALLRTILLNPAYVVTHVLTGARLTSVLALVLGFGGLALFAGWRIILLLPALEMLLANPGHMSHFNFYYGAVVMPFGAIAAVEGTRRLLRRAEGAPPTHPLASARLAFALAILLAATLRWHPSSIVASHPGSQDYTRTEHAARAEALMERIPEGARVTTTGYLAVHLQPGRDVAMFPYALDRAEWVLVDLQRPPWPSRYAEVQRRLLGLPAAGFTLEAAEDGLFLLRRASPPVSGERARADRDSLRDALDTPIIEAELSELSTYRKGVVEDPSASNGAFVRVDPSDTRGPGHALYGPYADLSPGDYLATTRLRWRDDPLVPVHPKELLVTVDVMAQRGGQKGKRELRLADLREGGWQEVAIPFTVQKDDRGIELRTWYHDRGTLDLDRVTVTHAPK